MKEYLVVALDGSGWYTLDAESMGDLKLSPAVVYCTRVYAHEVAEELVGHLIERGIVKNSLTTPKQVC